ncbi:Holliday junction resolvase RuvX [bacterium]|nr:Holliday junction resolvase RuvX [bacterium]MBO7084696.1 Holliday junction resolvase RuvX [bacterium]
MRILGIDYGTKITGLAITDYNQLIISPLKNIKTSSMVELVNQLKKVVDYYGNELDTIVLGYPTLLNGNANQTTLNVQSLYDLLLKTFPKLQIKLVNEQYTTYVATEDLYEIGLNHDQVRKSKDQVSAYLIIQSYIQQLKKSTSK